MAEFKTVADFVKIPDVMEAVRNRLQIQSLMNQVAQAPIEQKIKEVDYALKGNELLMTDIKNEKARWDLISAKNKETRDQTSAVLDTLTKVPELAGQNPEAAKFVLKSMFGDGADVLKNEDGTFTALVPGPGGAPKTMIVDPNRVGGPEKRASIEASLRKEFTGNKEVQNLNQINKNYQDMLSNASAAVPTGAGDVAIIISYMKMLDPGSVVREGEQEIARKTPGIPDQVWNLYTRATTSAAPIFGEAGSQARQNFIDVGTNVLSNAKNAAIPFAKSMAAIAESSGLRPENVVTPFGGLTLDGLRRQEQEELDALNRPAPPVGPQPVDSSTRRTPKEASVLPSRSAKPAAATFAPLDLSTPEKRAKNFDLLIPNLFVIPEE